jgi:hypothetical protein
MPRKRDKLDEILTDFFKKEKPEPEVQGSAAISDRKDVHFEMQACLFSEPMQALEESRMRLYRRALKGSCPPLELLAGFVDRVVDEKLARKIAEHLECCTKCAVLVKEGTRSVRDHAAGKTPRVPDDISTETTSRLPALHRKSRTPRKKGKRL